MQEILDDDDIKNKLLAPLEKELGGLQFWLFISGVLLLIAGFLGVFGLMAIMTRYYTWLQLLFFGGMFLAFLTAIPMAYWHFRYVRDSRFFCADETEENFEKLLITSSKDWRLLAFAFVFSTIAMTPLMGYETYLEWSRSHYIKFDDTIDNQPLNIPDEEFPIEEIPIVEPIVEEPEPE